MAGSELVKACCDYLSLKKVFFYRNNSGAYVTASGGFVRYGTPGSPDVVCVKDGKYIGLEMKMGSGRQSPNQKDFQKRLEAAGGIYHIIRSLDDIIALGL